MVDTIIGFFLGCTQGYWIIPTVRLTPPLVGLILPRPFRARRWIVELGNVVVFVLLNIAHFAGARLVQLRVATSPTTFGQYWAIAFFIGIVLYAQKPPDRPDKPKHVRRSRKRGKKTIG
jgi:hypothetical protein